MPKIICDIDARDYIMFAYLNARPNLKISRTAKGRTLHGGRNDAVTDLLAGCSNPAKIATIAHQFGMSHKEIDLKAHNASGFGQFRMSVGNKIRGICTRLEKAERYGEKLSLKKAAN